MQRLASWSLKMLWLCPESVVRCPPISAMFLGSNLCHDCSLSSAAQGLQCNEPKIYKLQERLKMAYPLLYHLCQTVISTVLHHCHSWMPSIRSVCNERFSVLHWYEAFYHKAGISAFPKPGHNSPGSGSQQVPDLMGDLLELGEEPAGPLSASDEQAAVALPPSAGQSLLFTTSQQKHQP